MRNIQRSTIILIILILITIITQSYSILESKEFSQDFAYYHLRMAEHIKNNGFPLVEDPLSYSSKTNLYPPLFHYLLAIFMFVLPTYIVGKILPIILFSLLIPLVFAISYELTQNKNVSLTAALFIPLTPIFYEEIYNNLSIYSIVLPLSFFVFYSFMKLREERKYLILYVIAAILLALTHSTVFLIVSTFIFYILILISESWTIRKINKEAILFLVLISLFFQFIIFREAYFTYGFSVIKQNIPEKFLSSYFLNIDLLSLITNLGVIPVILGIISIFIGIFAAKRTDSFLLLVSNLLAISILLFFKLITFESALLFIVVTLIILSSISINVFISYLKISRLSLFYNHINITLIFLAGIIMVPLSINALDTTLKNIPDQDDIFYLEWINQNIEEPAVILGHIAEGHLITYKTNKANVLDNYYLMAPLPENRIEEVKIIYQTGSESQALDLIRKYNVSYIFISNLTKLAYQVETPTYLDDTACFIKRRKDDTKLYQVRNC